MNTPRVKDLMVSLSRCAVVSEDVTLHDAVTTMEAIKMMFDYPNEEQPIILVHDEAAIIGQIRNEDVMWAMEPKYKELGEIKHLSRLGLSHSFAESILIKHVLWSESLSDLCRKASKLKMNAIMTKIDEDQYIGQDEPVTKAIHMMLLGNHSSLIVTDQKEAKGILRMIDIASHVFDEIKKCSDPIEDEL